MHLITHNLKTDYDKQSSGTERVITRVTGQVMADTGSSVDVFVCVSIVTWYIITVEVSALF